MIRAVIFDFFGVLVTEGFKQLRETYFHDDKQKDQRAIELINLVDSGRIPIKEFKTKLAELAGITVQEVSDLLGNNRPNKNLLAYIQDELNGKYKLSILSNSSEDYPRKLLDKVEVNLFDDILLSYAYGMVKPQKEIYEIAAKRLGIEPNEAVFTDDSEGHCQGAEKAGMKAILYRDFSQFKNDLEKLLTADSDN